MEKKQSSVEILYTEEQLRDAIAFGNISRPNISNDDWIRRQTPIELPTDEEIGKGRDENIPIDEKDMWSERFYFNIGAKWMRDKIKGGGDE